MRLKVIYAVAHNFSPLSSSDIHVMKREWEPFVSPRTEVGVARVRYGAETIESIYDCEMTIPFVLEEVRKAEEQRYDAVIIGCAGDPGLYGARELVEIPVVAVGETAMLLAIGLGRRFSVIVPERILEGLLSANVSKYGFASQLASIRWFEEEMDVRQLRDHMTSGRREVVKKAVRQAGRRAIECDGAGALVLGCGTLADVADDVSAELGVPVIHSRRAAVSYAEMLVRMGLSHSKTVYVRPLKKKRILGERRERDLATRVR